MDAKSVVVQTSTTNKALYFINSQWGLRRILQRPDVAVQINAAASAGVNCVRGHSRVTWWTRAQHVYCPKTL
jgi:hypothetical protein